MKPTQAKPNQVRQIQVKYSQNDLKQNLIPQVINGNLIYYSLVKKQGKNISFISNYRLLVYDSVRRILFYNNDYQNVPFVTAIPQPKNSVSTPIDSSDFANPLGTNNIQVRHIVSNSKAELETLGWNFTCGTLKLTHQWMNLLMSEKNKMKKPPQEKKPVIMPQPPQQPINSRIKETILRPEEQVIKPINQPDNYQSRNSKIQDPRQSRTPYNLTKSTIIYDTKTPEQPRKNYIEEPIVKPKQVINNTRMQPSNYQEQRPPNNPQEQRQPMSSNYQQPRPPNNIPDQRQPMPGNYQQPRPPNNNPDQRQPMPGNYQQPRPPNKIQEQKQPMPGNYQQPRPPNNIQDQRQPNNYQQTRQPMASNYQQPRQSSNYQQTRQPMASNYQQPRQPSNIQGQRPPSFIQQQRNGVDWNLRFLKNRTEETIYFFQQEAVKSLMNVWQRDCTALHQHKRTYLSLGLVVTIANCFTKDASQLKRQFRNYHFILQASKNQLIVGVPLCVLIEWQGTVSLIKAPIPNNAPQVRLNKTIPEVRQLERYTRVANTILQKAVLKDLTDLYGPNGDRRLVYVDNVIEYLPIHPDQQLLGTSLRPQYLLDSVGQVVPGGDGNNNRQQQKQIASACEGLSNCIKQLTEYLNEQSILWADALQLKDIFHNFGVNFKLLPRVYAGVSNKQVRKCMQSVMAAKVAKDILTQYILQGRFEGKKMVGTKVAEEYMRLLMEGNYNSSQVWKQLNLKSKKQYGNQISISQLIPGFFLNSLIKLLRVRADPTKINKKKKPFRQQGVFEEGMVTEIYPKIKSYYRFTTQFIDQVRYACRQQKKTEDFSNQIIRVLQLNTKNIPPQYQLNNNDHSVCQYLAYYTPPADLDPKAPLQHLRLYNSILIQPPSAFSLRITKAYLQWAIKKGKTDSFQKAMEEALKISEYWLQEGHLYQADLLQILSSFYASQDNAEESINFMKEALNKTIRNCGIQSRQTGNRYYELGQRQLKAGYKIQALQSLNKAKANMQPHKTTSVKYPLLMMRISTLQLNNGKIDACINAAQQAITHFDDYDQRTGSNSITEGYKVKIFQILARAYQIGDRKTELKSMASVCAKKFNRSQLDWTFLQMVRICLAAALFTHSQIQCQIFMGICRKLAQQQPLQSQRALKQLMNLSSTLVVMDVFLIRFNFLERGIDEIRQAKPFDSETRDFLLITKYVAAAVGQDYIQGLFQQKQCEQI